MNDSLITRTVTLNNTMTTYRRCHEHIILRMYIFVKSCLRSVVEQHFGESVIMSEQSPFRSLAFQTGLFAYTIVFPVFLDLSSSLRR